MAIVKAGDGKCHAGEVGGALPPGLLEGSGMVVMV